MTCKYSDLPDLANRINVAFTRKSTELTKQKFETKKLVVAYHNTRELYALKIYSFLISNT